MAVLLAAACLVGPTSRHFSQGGAGREASAISASETALTVSLVVVSSALRP